MIHKSAYYGCRSLRLVRHQEARYTTSKSQATIE